MGETLDKDTAAENQASLKKEENEEKQHAETQSGDPREQVIRSNNKIQFPEITEEHWRFVLDQLCGYIIGILSIVTCENWHTIVMAVTKWLPALPQGP